MRTFQRGQIMPLGLALTAAGALMALVLFNTGRVASDKTRLANAADAAAYSGLIWQARALNFQAYTNRAMVANQVAMAQAVSLRSWALYGKIATGNISSVLRGVPFVNGITGAMEAGMQTTEEMVSPITDGMLSVSNAVNGALSKAQSAMFASSFAATPEIIRNVVKANDSRFSSNTKYSIASQLRNVKDWASFTDGYDSSDRTAMKARIDVINRSRDPFSQRRDWNFFGSYMPVFVVAKFRLEKRGQTRLVEVTKVTTDEEGNKTGSETSYEWKAKDTLSLQFKYFKMTWRGPKWGRVETPIGWGEAIANNKEGDGSIEPCPKRDFGDGGIGRPECPRWLGHNRRAELMADNNAPGLNGEKSREKIGATFNGIQAYRSLNSEIEKQKDPRLMLRIEVAMPIKEISSSNAFVNSNRFTAPIKAPGDVLTSVSTAEVYYQRPEDALSVEGERANGYNPYWDVRLAATPKSERIVAVGLRSKSNTSLAPSVTADVLGSYISPEGEVKSDVQSEIDSIDNQMVAADPASAKYTQLEARKTQLQAVQNGSSSNGAFSDVDAIATAFGIAPSDLVNSQAYKDAIAGIGTDVLTGYVESKVAELGLDELKTQVEDELKAALEDAAKTILTGAMKGVLGKTDDVVGDARQAVNEINGKINHYEKTFNGYANTVNGAKVTAEGQIAKLNTELDKVKSAIAKQFSSTSQQLMGDLSAAKQPILDDIAGWQNDLTKDYEIPLTQFQIDDLNGKINAGYIDIGGLETTHKTQLAQQVMDIVNGATDSMKIDLLQAEKLIEMDNGEFILIIDDLKVDDVDVTEVDLEK